jgi:hypothetical protein
MEHNYEEPISTTELVVRRAAFVISLLTATAAVVMCVVGIIEGLHNPDKEMLIPFCLGAAPFCVGFGLMAAGTALNGLE